MTETLVLFASILFVAGLCTYILCEIADKANNQDHE